MNCILLSTCSFSSYLFHILFPFLNTMKLQFFPSHKETWRFLPLLYKCTFEMSVRQITSKHLQFSMFIVSHILGSLYLASNIQTYFIKSTRLKTSTHIKMDFWWIGRMDRIDSLTMHTCYFFVARNKNVTWVKKLIDKTFYVQIYAWLSSTHSNATLH